MSGKDMHLRLATREDMPAIEAMHFLSVYGLTAQDYSPAQVEAFMGHMGTYDPGLIDDGRYFVIERDGRIIASGGWSWQSPAFEPAGANGPADGFRLSPDSAKIRSIFVHPQYTRRGLASRLVQRSEAQAIAAGCRLLELWATLTGVPLYRRLGYEEVGRFGLSAPMVAPLTTVHMAKLVSVDLQAATAAA